MKRVLLSAALLIGAALTTTAQENLLAEWQPEMSFWFSPADWSGGLTPQHDGDIQSGFHFIVPEGTGSSQWQAQVHFNKGENYATLSKKHKYDFSVTITSSVGGVQATVKPQKDGDDNVFFTQDRFALQVGENVISLTDVAGFNGPFKLATDFAGAPAGSEFTISNIVLVDKGEADPVLPFDYNSEDNVWRQIDADQDFDMSFWWADGGWNQIGNPEFNVTNNKDGSKIYTIVAPQGGGSSEWQGQNTFNTNLPIAATDKVDLSLIVKSDVDHRMTVKLCQRDDDNNTLVYNGSIMIDANDETVLRFEDLTLSKGVDAPKVKLIIDLGGIQAGATFTVTDITLIRKGTATGIATVGQQNAAGEGTAFDLSGRRLPADRLQKGLYIIGGKKTIVR